MPGMYQIGDYKFVKLDRPVAPDVVVDMESFPGRSSLVWIMPNVDQLQTLRSIVDCEDLTEANTVWLAYRALKQNADALPVYWNSEEMPFLLRVRDVRLSNRGMKRILLSVGGTRRNEETRSRALLEVEWQVLAVPKPDEPEE